MSPVRPETRYAKSGDVSIAYQVVGDGPMDLVLEPGFVSHLEVAWEEPNLAHFLSRLASFTRLILFDKRGTGMSDPVTEAPTMEERMDDTHAVMDAADSEGAHDLPEHIRMSSRATRSQDREGSRRYHTVTHTVGDDHDVRAAQTVQRRREESR